MTRTSTMATGEVPKALVNYRTDAGVAIIELSDPPANAYSYEMNRQLDESILATPAISGGAIFLRSDQHLYCIAKNRRNP